MNDEKTVLYHVCNDYSLAPMEPGDPLPTEKDYEEMPHELGTALYHREYGELHYLRAPEGLEGKYA